MPSAYWGQFSTDIKRLDGSSQCFEVFNFSDGLAGKKHFHPESVFRSKKRESYSAGCVGFATTHVQLTSSAHNVPRRTASEDNMMHSFAEFGQERRNDASGIDRLCNPKGNAFPTNDLFPGAGKGVGRITLDLTSEHAVKKFEGRIELANSDNYSINLA